MSEVLMAVGAQIVFQLRSQVPKRQWVRKTSIPTVETSAENFLLNMESVCSQVVPRFDSSCKWEPVGTENGSVIDVF